MKLNPDCIRDILLAVEELSDYDRSVSDSELSKSKFLISYSENEILYHVRQLTWSKMLQQADFYGEGFDILDLSPQGHEFLNNIRSDDN
ncbi:DUF2513 domain-containing protein [Ligilactobacillus salivarius]